MLARAPAPHLRRFVSKVWATGDVDPASTAGREHVLPTGAMHLVFRLSGPPLCLFRDPTDRTGYTLGHAVVGGARSAFYARDVSISTGSVGAQLLPGAAMALFGAPADELAERHTPLDALWGRGAALETEQLQFAQTPKRRLAVLEALLTRRLASVRALHPAVAQALLRLGEPVDIGCIVMASGYSHRCLVALFRQATGLAPKTYSRVARFQRVLARHDLQPCVPWAELALEGGYSDQSHFSRDFAAMAGVTPETWRRAGARKGNHLPMPG